MAINPIMDLSERSVALAGQAVSNVLDRVGMLDTRDHHIAGILLIDELRRLGFSLVRPRPLRAITVVDAPAQARAMWEDPDATLELPALLMKQAE